MFNSDSSEEQIQKDQIMIVDDNPENLQFLVDVLSTNEKFIIRPVISSKLALQSISSKPPDLILLDIRMPDIDGFSVCKSLKSDDGLNRIPIIFVSALNDVDTKVKSFQMGGIDYVSKPFNTSEILARINTHLSLRKVNIKLEQNNDLLKQEIANRRKAEDNLKKLNTEIELRIEQRTLELANLNNDLQQKEKELKSKNRSLQDLNVALKSMLDQRVLEKQSIEYCMVDSLSEYISPYLDKIEDHIADEKGRIYIEIIKKNIEDLIAPVKGELHTAYKKMTPSEIRTSDLIRQGKSTKEIAEIMLVSPHTVSNFRYSIRKKLGIINQQTNLKSYLETMD